VGSAKGKKASSYARKRRNYREETANKNPASRRAVWGTLEASSEIRPSLSFRVGP